jgi:hypothetical protein
MTDKIKCNVKINLDQLKTLILTKGGQKRDGSFLPPPSLSQSYFLRSGFFFGFFFSGFFFRGFFSVSSSSILGAAHYLLTC